MISSAGAAWCAAAGLRRSGWRLAYGAATAARAAGRVSVGAQERAVRERSSSRCTKGLLMTKF